MVRRNPPMQIVPVLRPVDPMSDDRIGLFSSGRLRRPMGKQKNAQQDPAPAATSMPPVEVFVARQPIYDAAMAVVAYELLYRHSPRSTKAEITDPGLATLHVVTNAALEIGLERLAGGLPIHINFPEELLITVPDLPIRPELAVIEVLEDVQAKPKVIEGIMALRARGHRIALDDYSPRTTDPALLEFADIVKIEINQYEPEKLASLVKELHARNRGTGRLNLIAEQVETVEQFETCIGLGFDGFQGNFLQHP